LPESIILSYCYLLSTLVSNYQARVSVSVDIFPPYL
jgi:hypothetical protein